MAGQSRDVPGTARCPCAMPVPDARARFLREGLLGGHAEGILA